MSALAAGASIVAESQAQDIIKSSGNASTQFKTFAGVKNLREAKVKLSQLLSGTELSEWLKVFSPSLDEQCIQAIKKGGNEVSVALRLIYEPQLVEDLLASAGELLDQALQYRNELADLEISGINAALQYYMTVQAAGIAENFADASGNSNLLEIIRKGGSDAASAHSDKGDAITAKANSEAAKYAADQENLRVALSKKQISLILDGQSLTLKQLTASGGGRNFSQRYSRLLKYFLEDVSEAYQRCLCASLALESLYGITGQVIPRFTLSTISANVSAWAKNSLMSSSFGTTSDGSGVLDALVDWCRRNLRSIELVQRNEVEFTVIVPAVQKWTLTPGAAASVRVPIVGAAPLSAAMQENSNGLINFDLKPEHLAEEKLKNVRVIGVGVNVLSVNKSLLYSAIVTGPKQSNALVADYFRPPLIIGNVRSTVGNDNAFIEAPLISSPTCHNLTPIGNWTVKLRSRALQLDAAPEISPVRSEVNIKDIFLHLRVRATYNG